MAAALRPGARRRPVAVVGAPGAASELVVAAVVDAFGGEVVRVVRTRRTDRATPGSLGRRWRGIGGSTGDRGAASDADAGTVAVEIVVDVQWADDESLGDLVERATAGSSLPFVVVHRLPAGPAALAELRMLARRDGILADVGLVVPDELVAGGLPAERAAELVATTGGLPDLVALLTTDGGATRAGDGPPEPLVAEVTERLAVVDDDARRAAELVAFGVDVDRLATSGAVAGADRAVTTLTVEGLLWADRMPPCVAEAVRGACPSGRRAAAVEVAVGLGLPGFGSDLARTLLALGDRSATAGTLFREAADELATVDPALASRFADAAVAAGVAAADVAVARAVARLALGDPLGALSELGDADDPAAELVRGGAWAALGDLAAAADALARTAAPGLAVWADLGTGRLPGDRSIDDATAGGPAVEALVAALTEWWRGSSDPAAVLARFRAASVRFRAERAADRWPVVPDLLAALIAYRLGDVAGADRIVAGALAERAGGVVHARSTALASAWIAARRGHLDAAASVLADLAGGTLAPHERLLAAAARCGVAVRDAEGIDLDAAVADAADALAAVVPGLYDLDLVADVAAAATRSGIARFDPLAPLAPITDRLERGPAVGGRGRHRFDLARARLEAALAGDDLAGVQVCASTVVDAPVPVGDEPAERWQRAASVLIRLPDVDPGETAAVAEALAEGGHAHAAARVCGIAALVTDDEATARQLLRVSRVWRTTRRRLRGAPGHDRSVALLSEQEERVARLVAAGHTHKEIGAALFVSPKTVEHHVAHIRTKLGCSNRAEMLAALRSYVDEAAAPAVTRA